MSPQTRVLVAILVTMLSVPASAQAPAKSPAPASPQARPVLELSLKEAVARALENNVDIAVERFNPDASAWSVKELQGAYEPVVTSTVQQNSRTNPASSVFSGATKVESDTVTYNVGAFENLPTGGLFRIDFNNSRADTNSVFSSFNPSYSSNFNLSLTQPLLRNFRTDDTRTQIKVAKKNREISDVTFRQTVVNTTASVKQLYYDILYAIDNLEAQRKSLSLAAKLLEENEIKVRVGTMAPLDVVAAESEKALREEAVILAEAAVADAEDAIKRTIFNTNEPAVWATRIVPTDRPTAEPLAVDTEAAIRNALDKRTDIANARKAIENAEYNINLARNSRLPALDLVAAYGTNGIGGTLLTRQGLGGPIIQTVPGGYGDAVGDVFRNDFPTWTVGFNLSYPILNRQSQAASARARISKEQSQANLRRLEMQITQEVRIAARAVETNFKRVASTRAAKVLQVRRLDAETKKFSAGMSTNFLVTQSQRDLAFAEVAELRAIADYRKSIVDYERVQEAGGGSGGGASTGSARTTTSRTSAAAASTAGGSSAQQAPQ